MLRYAALESTSVLVYHCRSSCSLRRLSAVPSSHSPADRFISAAEEGAKKSSQSDLAAIFQQRLVDQKKQQDASKPKTEDAFATSRPQQQHNRSGTNASNVVNRHNGQQRNQQNDHFNRQGNETEATFATSRPQHQHNRSRADPNNVVNWNNGQQRNQQNDHFNRHGNAMETAFATSRPQQQHNRSGTNASTAVNWNNGQQRNQRNRDDYFNRQGNAMETAFATSRPQHQHNRSGTNASNVVNWNNGQQRNQRNDHFNRQGNATNSSSIRDRLAQQLGNEPPRPSIVPQRQPPRAEPPRTSSTASSIREMLARTTVTQNQRPTFPERPRENHSFSSEMLNESHLREQHAKSSSAKSIRDMLVATASAPPDKKRDMTDVANLREAFLKSIEKRKEQTQEQRVEQKPSVSQPAWRRDGAKGFRKRLQEEQKVQAEKLEQQRRMRAALNRRPDAFLMTQEVYEAEARQEQRKLQTKKKNDKTVMLPPREATITELSALFRVKIDKLMTMLKALGERPRDEDHMVDLDVMELVAMELGLEPVRSSRRRMNPDDDKSLLLQRRAGAEAAAEDDVAMAQVEAYDSLPSRPPVVCIMGHVDHGKTTLMDALRQKSRGKSKTTTARKGKKSKSGKTVKASSDDHAVAGTEAGGITQVISAFQVPLENQENAVTFLDTPGHAAFRAMRESGSNAADVIVLVVAADDGVSPQTIEIINFYKSIVKGSGGGGITMVVAMTKIDKHGIDISESRQRIENQLLEHGILSESFGSSSDSEYGPPVQVIPVSGLTGEGLDDLIEGLVLQSEIMDLRADEKAQAEGIVMDARMEKGVGVVADCIVRWGSLERGNVIVSGVHSGKVKALKDMDGATMKKASPSQPVRIFGFKSLPKAGEPVICVASEEVADQIIERREALLAANQSTRTSTQDKAEMQVMGASAKRGSSLEAVFEKYGQNHEVNGAQIRIPIIIRADGEGSLAALREALLAVGEESTLDLVIDPVSSGIGPISSSDVRMAKESGASIFSFGVKQNDKDALSMAEAEEVAVRSHDVIYSLLDDAKEVFASLLPAVLTEVVHGKAKVQAVFDVNNKKDAGRIAGLSVLDGILYKAKAKDSKGALIDCQYRVLRKGVCVSPESVLKVSSLRKVKEDVDDVRRGEECGLGLLNYTDFEKDDVIECYSVEMKREFV